MVVALTLGLMGSLGHCVGMCSAVVVMLNRGPAFQRSRLAWVMVHAGRVTSYALLGLLAAALGGLIVPGTIDHSAHTDIAVSGTPFTLIQGVVALLAAALAIYFALALIGWAPSPEIYLGALSGRWADSMRRVTAWDRGSTIGAYGVGIVWGMLPCGLVLTALLTAAVAPTPQEGALRMMLFGLGTVPTLLGIRWVTARSVVRNWPRYVAAILMVGFGLQFALRGMAAWGWISHQMVGGVMLW